MPCFSERALPLHTTIAKTSTDPIAFHGESARLFVLGDPKSSPPARARARFPRAATILNQLEHGAARHRVALRPEGRAPVRAGAPLLAAEEARNTSAAEPSDIWRMRC